MKLPFRMPFHQPEHDEDDNTPAPPSSTRPGLPSGNESGANTPTATAPAWEPALDAGNQPIPAVPPETFPQANTASANEPDTRVLLRVAEEAWRLGRRVDRAASDVGEAPLADVRDALSRLRDILSEAGIEAVDHDGERYVDGLRLHILHVEGDALDGSSLRIVRTIRPSILADGQVAVGGQVILGPADQETITP
jgi:hypothetical protein